MNDLEVKVIQNPGSIDFNFQEIKEALAIQMTAYTSLEITEDKQKEAKTDLATLRKIRKAVDDQRKSVKKDFMKPYTDFEENVKDLLSVIDEPINMIDGKLKEFEAKRVAEKQKHLNDLYEEHIGEYREYLPYSVVANDKWTNATYSDKDIIYDISEAVTKVKSDLNAIKALHSEIEDECIQAYKNAWNNLAAAITKNSDYMAAKAKAEQRVREEAERKAELEKQKEVVIQPSEPVKDPTEENPTADEPTFTFRVTGLEHITLVKKYLDFAEIKYEEV